MHFIHYLLHILLYQAHNSGYAPNVQRIHFELDEDMAKEFSLEMSNAMHDYWKKNGPTLFEIGIISYLDIALLRECTFTVNLF